MAAGLKIEVFSIIGRVSFLFFSDGSLASNKKIVLCDKSVS